MSTQFHANKKLKKGVVPTTYYKSWGQSYGYGLTTYVKDNLQFRMHAAEVALELFYRAGTNKH